MASKRNNNSNARQTNLFDRNGRTRNFSTASGRNTFPTTAPVPGRGPAPIPPRRPPGGFGGQAPGQLELRTPLAGGGRQQRALPPGNRGGAITPSRGGGMAASGRGGSINAPGGPVIPPQPPRLPRRLGAGGGLATNGITDVRVRDAFPRQMTGSAPQNALPPGRQRSLPAGQRGGALTSQRVPADPYANAASAERARGRARGQYNQAANAAEAARAARASGTFPNSGPAVRRAPGRIGTPQTPAGGRPGPLSGRTLRGVGGKLLGPAVGAVSGVGTYNENRAAGRSQTTSALKGVEEFARNATGIGALVNTAQGIRNTGYDMLGIPKGVQNVMNAGDVLLLGPAGLPGAMEPLYQAIDRASPREAAANSRAQSPTTRGRFPGVNQRLPQGTSQRGPITGSMRILPRTSGGDGGGVGDVPMGPAPAAPRLPRPSSTAPINNPGSVFAPQAGQAPRPNTPVPGPNAPVASAQGASPAPSSSFAGVGPVADGARYQDKLNAASATQNPGAPDPERRRAFLDAKDSMAGAKAVRDLKERRRRLTIELD